VTAQLKHRLVAASTTFAGAAIAVDLPYALLGAGAWNSLVEPWTLVSTAMFLTAFLAARCATSRTAMLRCVAGLLGVVSGVLGQVAFDTLVNHRDHNLFPIEIIVMVVLAMPGALAGMGAAKIAERRDRDGRLGIRHSGFARDGSRYSGTV
jgi:hypothetical protein